MKSRLYQRYLDFETCLTSTELRGISRCASHFVWGTTFANYWQEVQKHILGHPQNHGRSQGQSQGQRQVQSRELKDTVSCERES